MSLVEQSQQWYPTSVQVTVHQARNLRFKGKNGTNDAYAIIQVAKDKFSTCVAEKSVDPVWKEEASFDLPLFHPGNAERCTLYIIVMHRAKGGLDKFLGQAVINLVDLHENKARKKTDWFKLVEKSGKEDKERGEVLLDITFMRNNMSASMFDLSMQDKPRSRISKLKDKVRGKKKDSFSDSASAIVPSVSQVLTDSEGEADSQSLSQSPGMKKKSKLKTLFAPKSNLHRNVSQSMSTLGTLPEKNSSLSGSRSSGLNVDSPDTKKKFKIFGHKRTGSSDSRVSQGPFSLLGRSKQSNVDQNNLCINGSHVYAEDAETKSGSTVSLNSAGSGEDFHRHTFDISTGPFGNAPDHAYRPQPTDRAVMEQHRHQEEEERRQAEERREAEAKRLEEQEKHRIELRRLQEEEERRQQEEQERKRKFLEDEARRQKQREEEEVRRKQEEERREAESRRLEEERRKAEEQKKQEEASMSERLSTLFGIIRKKEDKKEDQSNQEVPAPTTIHDSRGPEPQVSHHSTNPFEDIPLSSDNPFNSTESPSDHQRSSPNAPIPSAMVFLNRTAKVSAVKPRLAQSPEPEPPDFPTPSEPSPSPATPESTLSSLSSASPDLFANLHSSLAPPNLSQSRSGSPRGSTENLSLVESEESSVMADKKRKAPLPPLYPATGNQTAGNGISVSDVKNSSYIEADGAQGKKSSMPLPDYETLFPQRRHGVQGQTRWDHIIAEVNQKHRDSGPVLLGPEMSVDGPQERQPSPRSSISVDSLISKTVSSRKGSTNLPIPPTTPRPQSPAASTQRQSQSNAQQSVMRTSYFEEQDILDSDGPSALSRNGERKALQPPSAATQVSINKEVPTARPRQVTRKESDKREESPLIRDKNLNGSTQNSFPGSVRSMGTRTENFGDFNRDNSSKEKRPETQGMTADDLDQIFGQEKPADPFVGFNGSDSNTQSEQKSADDSMPMGFHVFERKNSQRKKQTLASNTQPDNQSLPAQKEQTTKTGATRAAATRDIMKEPKMPDIDVQNQSSFYGGDAHFAGEDVFLSSAPLQVIMEEPAGSQSGGKTPLQAWVSPSEVQPTSVYNSPGGGLGLTPRRPHPVKPLTPAESQFANSSQSVKDIKFRDSAPGKIKVSNSNETGPFSQLTQEELITLVVKQQTDLSRKDAKITELEEYIDQLLLRVIEEKPSILQALTSVKPV